MMDRAGKHFSASGCSHDAASQVSHPSRLTPGCHLNSCGCGLPPTATQSCPTITQTRDGTIETGGGNRGKMMLLMLMALIRERRFVISVVTTAQSARLAC